MISEFLKNVPATPPISFRFSPSLQVLPPASTAPNTGGGSDLHSQGGRQQADLLTLRLSPHVVIYSFPVARQNVFSETIIFRKGDPKLTRYIATFLHVDSEVRTARTYPKLRIRYGREGGMPASADLVAFESRSFVGTVAEWFVRGFPAAA